MRHICHRFKLGMQITDAISVYRLQFIHCELSKYHHFERGNDIERIRIEVEQRVSLHWAVRAREFSSSELGIVVSSAEELNRSTEHDEHNTAGLPRIFSVIYSFSIR